jgi:hypothetical protein
MQANIFYGISFRIRIQTHMTFQGLMCVCQILYIAAINKNWTQLNVRDYTE